MTPLRTVAVQSTGQISFDVHFPLEGLVGTAGPSDRMFLGCFFPVCLAEHRTVMVEARAWGSEILDDFGTFETLYNLQSAIVREYVCFSLRVYIMGHCAGAKEKARGLVRLTGAYRIPQNGHFLQEK